MQQQPPKNENYSIEQFNDLIESIKKRTGLNEEAIAARINYNKGYISQARSRGEVSQKFIQALQTTFAITLQNTNTPINEPESNYESRRSLENTLEKMAEDKLRSTAIIERLVTLLENRFSLGEPSKASEAPHVTNIPTGNQAKPIDLGLDKKYEKSKGKRHGG